MKAARQIRIEGDVAYVPLSAGYEAVIDVVDIPLVAGRNWCVKRSGRTNYAIANGRRVGGAREPRIWMHRVIAKAAGHEEVDHEDRDGLNNRRRNLTPGTHAENMQNVSMHRDNRLGVKGVHLCKETGRYRAQLMVAGKRENLGRFPTAEAASVAYATRVAQVST
jgi:hypothetical protein